MLFVVSADKFGVTVKAGSWVIVKYNNSIRLATEYGSWVVGDWALDRKGTNTSDHN
jgi:hypothetical protein